MEQQAPAELSAVARGHNAVHVLPADWSLAPSVLAATLDRIDATAGTTQMLVIVADADAAVALTQAITASRGGTNPRVIAATGADRAARVLRAGGAPVVVGAPEQLVALLRASALKLDTVRTLAVAWVEEILSAGAGEDLETVLADVPKDAARIVMTGAVGPSVEDFIERHARRAPRIGASGERSATVAPVDRRPASPPAIEGLDPQAVTVSYMLTTPTARTTALRRVLDEIDPPSAAVYVRSDESERAVRETLDALGYHGPDGAVRALRGDATEHTALVVLFDVPHSATEWRGAVAGLPARAVALLLPRQLAQLGAVTGRPMTPLPFSAPLNAARAQEAAVRQQLRRELASGTPSRELLALEPLLVDFDGVALAAAALRLLERERTVRSQANDAARAATAAAAATAATADRAVRPTEPPASPPRADRAESDRPRFGSKGDRGASGRPPQRDRRPDSSPRGSERPGTARGGASPYPRDRNHGSASGGGRGRPDRGATDHPATPRPTKRDFGSRGPKVGPSRRRPSDDRPDPRDARPQPRSPR